MTRTQQTIARQIRTAIERHSEVALSAYGPQGITQEEYCATRAVSDRAVSLARYLGEHMQGLDVRAFGAACGVRLS